MLFNLLQTGIEAVPQSQEMSESLISMAVKGGWLMIVLLLLSFCAIYIFGKKWWMIRKATKVDKNFMKDIRDYIHEGKVKSAVTLCERIDSPVARLVQKGVERIGRPLDDIQTAVGSARTGIVFKLAPATDAMPACGADVRPAREIHRNAAGADKRRYVARTV